MLLKQYGSLFFIAIILVGVQLIFIFSYDIKATIIMWGSLLIGIVLLLFLPIHKEQNYFKDKQCYILQGDVVKVKETKYYKWLVIDDVQYQAQDKWQSLKSKVEIRVSLDEEISLNDHLQVKVEKLVATKQMNPSDMDTPLYLKGQGIASTFKMLSMEDKVAHETLFEKIQVSLTGAINSLYQGSSRGILCACLLGDTSDMYDETKEVYNAAGIGHVLAISGFHVSVVMSVMMLIAGYLKMSYTTRNVVVMVMLILYAQLTGASISTTRAVIMASVCLIGRSMWQEEDGITSLALAALLILVNNPYQLFQVGFQLSFVSVGGMYLLLREIEKQELMGEWEYQKWQKTLLSWLIIQCVTWPILAYHYFEIPFLISAINLLVIPLFTIIIVGGWLSVLLWLLGLSGKLIALCIESVLEMIEYAVSMLLKCPYATVVVGRPSLFEYLLYIVAIICIMSIIFKWEINKRFQYGVGIIMVCFLLIRESLPMPLKIATLYVGQGDGIVVETPRHEILVIDGGNEGFGDTLSRYIKYCGKNRVEAMFLSHSDADHISGLIEMIQSDVHVEHLFISQIDYSSHLNELVNLCEKKQIPVTKLEAGETVFIDKVSIECMAPINHQVLDNINDCSMVQLLEYGKFSMLLTGDKSWDSDPMIYNKIGKVTVLKVSHHGSRTGTDETMLNKIAPYYAVISCGINNHYGHPHQEVVKMIEEKDIELSRTDEEGAIFYETDGKYCKAYPFVEHK